MSDEDDDILEEAKKRFNQCVDWEAVARVRFDYDYKFANGDSHNLYQWDNRIVVDRTTGGNNRPVLTVNKTQQHNLMIINDAKQNKPGINVRPVGDDASFDAAQVYQEIVRHIEYISNAETVYDHATTFQVQAGIGYWRVITKYMNAKSWNQEIYIERIKDPRSVYLDPDINEADGSDARFGFIFDDMPKDLYNEKYPDFIDAGWSTTFSNYSDGWYTKDHVRIAEYFRKTEKKDKLVLFTIPQGLDLPHDQEQTGQEVEGLLSELTKEQKEIFDDIKKREKKLPLKDKTYRERNVITENIEWFKIAGNKIIDRKPWLGIYIPIVRLPGTETVIDGVLDRKGHTRALINAQQIYNYNTSANVEYGALQTKSPWIAPSKAIAGFEAIWATANTVNHSYLPYNAVDEDGEAIPAPTRPAAPQASPAYVKQMEIAQNEMMMVSGQYQAQMGENENAKSGVAINARQRQGDRATYHFIDNNGIAIRFTGKILIDLITKIYDAKRVMRISAKDGSIMNVTVDPNAEDAFTKVQNPEGPDVDKAQQMAEIIFNPNVGTYDVIADVGPSYATRRQEAFNALTQIAAQNKDFMNIAGDVLWKVADFPEAQILAERWRKIIPPNITGDALDPKVEDMMHKASDQIQQQLAQIAQLTQQLEDKDRDLKVKEGKLTIEASNTMLDNLRADYRALDDRIKNLGNSGPAISIEQIQPLIRQVIMDALKAGAPGADMPDEKELLGLNEGGTPISEFTDPSEPEPAAPQPQGAQ